jgi:hypothetical protein
LRSITTPPPQGLKAGSVSCRYSAYRVPNEEAGELAKVGYCGECGRYVELNAEGACPDGHPRSSLRDVREGCVAQAPVVGQARAAEYHDEGGMLAQVIGKGIVIVPVALIIGWGLLTGFERARMSGISGGMALLYAVLALAATVLGAFVQSWRRRR